MDTAILIGKTCSRCTKVYPATTEYFYKCSKVKDGLKSLCKNCHNSAERTRSHQPENKQCRLELGKQYRNSVHGQAIRKKQSKIYDAKHRGDIKVAARQMLYNAIRRGELLKESCEICHSKDNVNGHHEDYTKPLVVIWLCSDCHRKFHLEKRRLERD